MLLTGPGIPTHVVLPSVSRAATLQGAARTVRVETPSAATLSKPTFVAGRSGLPTSGGFPAGGLTAPAGGGIVLVGDTLLNQGDNGLTLLPEAYIEDRKQALKSLQLLLELDFKTITFAHGNPIVGDAKSEITKFLKKPKKKNS